MGLKEYAEQELKLYFPDSKDDDEMDKVIKNHLTEDVMNLIKLFEIESHSGFSANVVLSLFERLSHWKPLTPLTGADDEWNDVDEETFQNKRCSSVFKDKETGECYDIDGKVFSTNGGKTYHISKDSRVYISFPYVPPIRPERIILEEGGDDEK